MAMSQQTLEVGRKGLNKLFFIESQKVPAQYKDILGNFDNTTETFVRRRQLAGLAPAVQTPEGDKVAFDDMYQLFQRDFAPVLFTKGTKFTKQTKYTDQYGAIAKLQPMYARAFMHKKNQVAANLDILGFTDTTYGMNAETLYSTTHSMGSGVTGSNRPATDIAFGPLALEQATIEIRKQKSARSTPMPYTGKLKLLIPRDLEPSAYRVLNAVKLAGTNNNDPNYAGNLCDLAPVDYYTSTTAWFLRAMTVSSDMGGKFIVEQMPYEMEQLPLDEEVMWKWIGTESYIVGWDDWHGTWGTTGA